jgi:hypothetical protein
MRLGPTTPSLPRAPRLFYLVSLTSDHHHIYHPIIMADPSSSSSSLLLGEAAQQQPQQPQVYSDEQTKVLDVMEAEAHRLFPPSSTVYYANIDTLKAAVQKWAHSQGAHTSHQGRGFWCKRAAQPKSFRIAHAKARLQKNTPLEQQRHRTSARCGCAFVIKFAMATPNAIQRAAVATAGAGAAVAGAAATGAAAGSVRITEGSNYRHTNGCFPSQCQLIVDQRSSGYYQDKQQVHHDAKQKHDARNAIIAVIDASASASAGSGSGSGRPTPVSCSLLREMMRPLYPPTMDITAQDVWNMRLKVKRTLLLRQKAITISAATAAAASKDETEAHHQPQQQHHQQPQQLEDDDDDDCHETIVSEPRQHGVEHAHDNDNDHYEEPDQGYEADDAQRFSVPTSDDHAARLDRCDQATRTQTQTLVPALADNDDCSNSNSNSVIYFNDIMCVFQDLATSIMKRKDIPTQVGMLLQWTEHLRSQQQQQQQQQQGTNTNPSIDTVHEAEAVDFQEIFKSHLLSSGIVNGRRRLRHNTSTATCSAANNLFTAATVATAPNNNQDGGVLPQERGPWRIIQEEEGPAAAAAAREQGGRLARKRIKTNREM